MNNIFTTDVIERKHYKQYLFSDEQKNLIKNLYESGKTTKEIGNMFNVSYKTIARLLQKLDVQLIGNGQRQYELNECYFDTIDTGNKAYILGFLYADGCNSLEKSTISMALEEGDRDILERIRLEVGSAKELVFIDYSNKHDFGYTYKNQYRLLFFSAHMCESLALHGMTPRKSLSLSFPSISDDLLPHFIRGYIDGDGCIYKQNGVYIVTITSTKQFCEKIQSVVYEKLGINSKIEEASNKNGITYVWKVSKKSDTKKFLDWVYDNAEMYLKRKHDVYVTKYCEEYK